jgi:glutamate--cysteine ligase
VDGLQAQVGDIKMLDVAKEVLDIARGGLKARARPGLGGMVQDERHFLHALEDSVETGKTPADELLDKYNGEWHGDLTRIYGEFSY